MDSDAWAQSPGEEHNLTPAIEAAAAFGDVPSGAAVASRRFAAWLSQQLAVALKLVPGPKRLVQSRRTGIDKCTGLYDRGALVDAGQAFADRAVAQPFGIIVLDFSELREVRDIYGPQVSRKLIAKVVRRVEALAGRRGLVGRTDVSQFTVLLPGACEKKALRAVQRVLGKPARIEFDVGDSEIVLVPEMIVDSIVGGEQRVESLHASMCRELVQRQNTERLRQSYLTRERERHSRPMSLPAR
jgi:diguanylate cyclase (GGDEF)-like protein